ncbi:hypothetical protein [Rossellomorea marisflavi]|uniref:hypothetical protein n=1 Tax=Rossellomorea marisflavi TaxID=189381 RepID=UPI003F9F23C5
MIRIHWLKDIILIIGFTLAFFCYDKMQFDNLRKMKFKTKDGYEVTIKQLQQIRKHTVSDSLHYYPLERMENKSIDVPFILKNLMLLLIVYSSWSFLGLSNPRFLTLSIILFLFIMHSLMMSELKQEIKKWVKTLHIETPSEFASMGKYLNNPMDAVRVLKKIKEYQEKLNGVHLPNLKGLMTLEVATSLQGINRNNPDWFTELRKLESETSHYEDKLYYLSLMLNDCLATDTPVSYIQEIVEQNQFVHERAVTQ